MGDYFDQACAVVERPVQFAQDGTDNFWRMDEPTLVEGKLVKGGMFTPQRTWWDLDNFIKVFVAGYGSGKTLTGCKRIISLALENAPCPVAAISPTYPMARQTTIATIKELLSGKQTLFGRALWWKFNSSVSTFTIKFKGRTATILIYSAEDPESLKGPNLAAALLDEPFLMVEDAFKQMIARVRHPNAKHKELALTGTPEQLNWGYDLCIGETNERYDVGFVQASTRTNLVLGDEYVKRLEGAFTDKAGDAFIDGKFVNLAQGVIYYAFDRFVHVHDLPIPPNAELGCGMDFNVNPFAFLVFWRAGAHIHVFAEFELPNADTEYACSVLLEKFVRDPYDPNGEKGRITPQKLRTVYPDATGSARKTAAPGGKSDFTYIKQAGFEINSPDANPKIRDRENAVNARFKPRGGIVTLTVDPKCKRLIKYLSLHTHEQRNDQEAMTHLISALGYPVSRLFPVDRDSISSMKLIGA